LPIATLFQLSTDRASGQNDCPSVDQLDLIEAFSWLELLCVGEPQGCEKAIHYFEQQLRAQRTLVYVREYEK
jgi:hypothetical protein